MATPTTEPNSPLVRLACRLLCFEHRRLSCKASGAFDKDLSTRLDALLVALEALGGRP